MNFKLALENGKTREEIMAELEAALNDAENEIKAEQAAAAPIAEARDKAIKATLDYAVALDIIPVEGIDAETIKAISAVLEQAEKELVARYKIIDMVENLFDNHKARPEASKPKVTVKEMSGEEADKMLKAWLKRL